MSEHLKIKRGLYRLSRATVRELAAFSKVNESTVRNFLNGRGDICTREESSSGPEDMPVGRGRPSVVWVLTSTGRAALLKEIEQEYGGSTDEDIVAERYAATQRIASALDDFERLICEIEKGDVEEEVRSDAEYLRNRLRSLERAVEQLHDSGIGTSTEKTLLRSLNARLNTLERSRRIFEAVEEVARRSLRTSLETWFRNLEDVVEKVAAQTLNSFDVFLPDEMTEIAPVLIFDGSEAATHCVPLQSATGMPAVPTMRLRMPIDEEAQRNTLLNQVAEYLTTDIGSLARIVYVLDHRSPSYTQIASSFRSFDGMFREHKLSVPDYHMDYHHVRDSICDALQIVEIMHGKDMGILGNNIKGVSIDTKIELGCLLSEKSLKDIPSFWCDVSDPKSVRHGVMIPVAAHDRSVTTPETPVTLHEEILSWSGATVIGFEAPVVGHGTHVVGNVAMAADPFEISARQVRETLVRLYGRPGEAEGVGELSAD